MARPTDYTPQLLEKARDYLANYQVNYGDVVPQIAGLACALNVSRETIYAWSKEDDKEEFSDIVEQLRGNQERTLINGGLKGDLNASITKLALVKHGYQDQNKTELAGEVSINAMSDDQLNARIAAILNP